MKRRKAAIWSIAVITLGALWPMVTYGQPDDFVFHHLRVQDGLSQATNAFIFKDSRGFVWISSISGLNRFDGTHVKVYTPDRTDPATLLGENIQSEFFEDKAGDIWFCTYDALHRYDYSHDCFDVFQIPDSTGHPRVGYYVFYLDAAQYVWMILEGYELYTYHIPTGVFQKRGNVPPNTQRCSVHVDPDGQPDRIYTRGQLESGVQVLQPMEGEVWSEARPLPLDPVLQVRGGIKAIPQGDTAIWILTPQYFAIHSLTTHSTRMTPVRGAKDMVIYNERFMLIGTLTDGLLFMNRQTMEVEGQVLTEPKSKTSLLSNSITYLYLDPDRVLWTSSIGVGISYTDPAKRKFRTTYFPAYEGPGKDVIPRGFEPVRPGVMLCFTRSSGVIEVDYRHPEIKFSPIRANGIPFPREVHLAGRHGVEPFWIASWQGLFRYDAEANILHPFTGDSLVAYGIHPAANNGVFFSGSNDKVLYIQQEHDQSYSFQQIAGFRSKGEYFPIWEDHRRRLWSSNQMQRIEIVDSTHTQLLASLPLPGFLHRLALSPDSSVVWIAGSAGLYKIDAHTLAFLKQYDNRNGMPAGGLNDMQIEPSGIIWLSHANGILRFDPVSETITSYDVDDGLPAFEFSQSSARLDNGELWFGAVGSIVRFFPDQLRQVQTYAIPQITELRIHDKTPAAGIRCLITGATHIPEIQKLCVSYKDNALSFSLSAMEYSAPARNKIRYRMDGLEQNFVEVSNGHQVRYPDMPPGDYKLIVYATNADGVENPEPRILDITILPPFYKTWWFYTLVVLAAISIIAYIVYLRFSKALELQKVRLRLYENLHDDVGSRLMAIALSAEELERAENYQNPKLSRIKHIARSIVGNMKRLVWAIDPENDRMSSIIQKINHDRGMILREDIDFRLEVDPGLRPMVVPGEIRYQISAICSEALNNIAKYAEATEVRVRITRDNGHIRLTVADNGKGFDPESASKDRIAGSGYGLGNMQKRADRVKGRFEVRSKPGEGTRIEFTFPFR